MDKQDNIRHGSYADTRNRTNYLKKRHNMLKFQVYFEAGPARPLVTKVLVFSINFGASTANIRRLNPQKGFVNGPDIAAEPLDLQVHKFGNEGHQYIYLSWRPPQDGSYNYLTGFLVQVTVLSFNPSIVGSRLCYKIIPAPSWLETHRALHRQGGVVFYMNCLRTESWASLDVIITIQSLPLKRDAPKLANTTVFIRPESTEDKWNPKFKKWADENDVMHLVIENPLKAAMFYHIEIQSTDTQMVVFKHVFPAKPDNVTQNTMMTFTPDGKPHFYIDNLNKDDNYTILMDVLDENGIILPRVMSIETKPFRLNFSSDSPVTTAATSDGVIVSPIIIVFIVVVICVSVFAYLWYNKALRPSSLRILLGNSKLKSASQVIRKPTLTAIYCYDNDNFRLAVAGHIALVHKYMDILNNHYNSHSDFFSTNVNWSGLKCAEKYSRDQDVMIYLSPRLGQILKLGHESSPALSCADVRCFQTLMSLRQHFSTGKKVSLHLVTFDCFRKAEMAVIDELLDFIHQQTQDADLLSPKPLQLSTFTPNGWRLDNLERLLLELYHRNEFPQDINNSLCGWRETPEACRVEHYLYLLNTSDQFNERETESSYQQEGSSVSLNASYNENTHKNSSDDSARVLNKPFRRKDKNNKGTKSHDDPLFSLLAPLISASNDHRSRCAQLIQDSLNHKENRFASSAHSPAVVHSQCHVWPSELSTGKLDVEVLPRSAEIKRNTNWREKGRVAWKTPNKNNTSINKWCNNPVDFISCDFLSSTDDLKSRNRSPNIAQNEDSCDSVSHQFRYGLGMLQSEYALIPPSLSHTNATSMDSVCECINKINDSSPWSDSAQIS